MSEQPEDGDQALLDVEGLAGRLRRLGLVVGALALVGVVADGLVRGLTFAVLARWVGISGAVLLVLAAVVVSLDALQGAGRAQRRGERLSGGDVGLAPSRRRK